MRLRGNGSTRGGNTGTCLPKFAMPTLVFLFPSYSQADVPHPLSTISYHGSLMLQHLLHFADPSTMLRSMAAMTPEDLVTLACDPAGSHVFDTLLASPSVSEKQRRKVLRLLKVSPGLLLRKVVCCPPCLLSAEYQAEFRSFAARLMLGLWLERLGCDWTLLCKLSQAE